MALDGIFLRYIKHEIETEALGARVSQIYQPNRDELVFAMRTFNGNKKLLLSARANSPRVHFCSHTPENPPSPPMFCMLTQANRRRQARSGSSAGVRQSAFSRL
jgi:predicted ribosome quality control (RQC) complex YloA/Tae2 family protein